MRSVDRADRELDELSDRELLERIANFDRERFSLPEVVERALDEFEGDQEGSS